MRWIFAPPLQCVQPVFAVDGDCICDLLQRVWRGLRVTISSPRVHIAGLLSALSEGKGESRRSRQIAT